MWILAACTLLALKATPAEYAARWIGPTSGAWTNPTNWDTPNFPNNVGGDVYDVVLEETEFFGQIALDESVTIRNFTLNDFRELIFADGVQLEVAGEATWEVADFGGGEVQIYGDARLGSVRLRDSRLTLRGNTILANQSSVILLDSSAVTNSAGALFEMTDLHFEGNRAGRFENMGTVRLLGIDGAFNRTLFRNSGIVEVLSSTASFEANFDAVEPGFKQIAGELRLGASAGPVTMHGQFVIDGGAVSGFAVFTGPVTNNAILSPGAEQGGRLVFDSLTLGSNALTRIQVGHSTNALIPFDRIDGTEIVLDGELDIRAVQTIQPQDSFAVVRSSGSLTGAFRNVASGQRLSTADGSGSFLVRYGDGSDAVVLSDYSPQTGFQIVNPAPTPFYAQSAISVFPAVSIVGNEPIQWDGGSAIVEITSNYSSANDELGLNSGSLGNRSRLELPLGPGTTTAGLTQAIQAITFGLGLFRFPDSVFHREPDRELSLRLTDALGHEAQTSSRIEFNRLGSILLGPRLVLLTRPATEEKECNDSFTVSFFDLLGDFAGSDPWPPVRVEPPFYVDDDIIADNVCINTRDFSIFGAASPVVVQYGDFSDVAHISALPSWLVCILAGLIEGNRHLNQESNTTASAGQYGAQAHSQTPSLSLPPFQALEQLMRQTETGRRWVELYWQHTAEALHIVGTNADLIPEMIQVLGDFQPGVAKLLGGSGENFDITRTMIDRLNSVCDRLIPLASAELRRTLLDERARFNDFQDFIGRDFNQWAEMLGLAVPNEPFIYVCNSRQDAGAFVTEANYVEGLSYCLWRTPDLASIEWQLVPDAVVKVNGHSVSLTDVTPPTGQTFYQIRASASGL